jgi:hypothetical protein
MATSIVADSAPAVPDPAFVPVSVVRHALLPHATAPAGMEDGRLQDILLRSRPKSALLPSQEQHGKRKTGPLDRTFLFLLDLERGLIQNGD